MSRLPDKDWPYPLPGCAVNAKEDKRMGFDYIVRALRSGKSTRAFAYLELTSAQIPISMIGVFMRAWKQEGLFNE